MAANRPVKKTGKKTPLRKAGHKQQAKKPIGRKSPMGKGRKSSLQTPRARKTGKSARPTTKEPRLTGSAAAAHVGDDARRRTTTARKKVRSGRTTARRTRKDERPTS